MKIFVDETEIEIVRKRLETDSIFSKFFGEEWIKENFLNQEERSKKHMMFWVVLEEIKYQKMEDWLSTLKRTLPETKFVKIVNTLKEKRGKNKFYSFIPEIEVLAYYLKQENDNFKVEFEPKIPGKTKVGDIKLMFDSNQIFLEITRLFASEKEERINAIMETIHKKIDEIEDNPFLISFKIEERFVETDIGPFVSFVKQKIPELRGELEKSTAKSIKMIFENRAWFMVHKEIGKKGHVSGAMSPVMMLETGGRLKHKILDKIEQLPDNHLNVIVLDISHHFAHFEDITDAFGGQEGLKIDVKTMEATPFRHANGVVQVDDGRKVSVIIGFKGFDYEHRKKYVNLSAENPFTDELLSQI